jgi:hypothetical protein
MPVVYNVWVIGNDDFRYWYTQCDSLEAAEKREKEFRRITLKDEYKRTLITFTPKEFANADITKEWPV